MIAASASPSAPDSLRRRLDAAPMSHVQIRAVAMTVILSALDGYDVLSVTFAAPAISHEWQVGKAALGVVLSSGLAGMALGSFLLAPLADWVGRRWLVLVSLLLMALGTLMSALAGGLVQLAAWRLVTGLGIGACIAVINPLAAEFANARRRPFAVALMSLGFPAGGLVGGLLASALLASLGWRAVFAAGFAAAAVLTPVTAWLLPESPAHLGSRRGPDSLARLNALLGRFGQPPMEALPLTRQDGRGYAGVFGPGQLATTIRLTVVNMLATSVVYYLLSWLPQMVSDAGFGPSKASLAAALSSLSGIVGGVLLGAYANRAGLIRLTVIAIVGLAVTTTMLGVAPPSLPLLMVIAGLSGFALYSVAAGIYATLALAFADRARASGSGFVIGVGRISSAVTPLLAGRMFAAGLGRAEVSAAFGACALVAAGVLATHRVRQGAPG